MRSTLSTGTAVLGVVVVVLLGFVANGMAASLPVEARFNVSHDVLADSALAMFLLGLAVGVPAGIILFFCYLVTREKRETEQDREMDELLATLSDEEGQPSDPWRADTKSDSRQKFDAETSEENRDPWERPADWWRHAGGGDS
ncbi:MAG: hypothetical protein KDN19_20705 [Verrucomicrobiae bacterium]|nr:hypothetical protein [Verrucomicrobiae bacterium]